MKKCLVNAEGEHCDRPVVGGGRCDLHQVKKHYGKKGEREMKIHKPKSRKK